MDSLTVSNNGGKGTAVIHIPGSKSYAHRYILASALCPAPCEIENLTYSKDIEATLDCVRQLQEGSGSMDCNESASTLRFMIPISLIRENTVTFTGKGRLMERPLTVYTDIFQEKGIRYVQKPGESFFVSGRLKSGDYHIDGGISSQFITGLLFALPLLDGDSRIIIENTLQSKPYVDITLEVLAEAGIQVVNQDYRIFTVLGNQQYRPARYTVQGDYSSAAFFLAAGLLKGGVVIRNLKPESLQGDKAIIEFFKQMGGQITWQQDELHVEQSNLQFTGEFDVMDCPDIVPILAMVCSVNNGTITLKNTSRLKVKECDRGTAITDVLTKLGGKIQNRENEIVITGVKRLKGQTVSSYNDHRIAMTEAVASLVCDGAVTIENPMCVEKSYPDFYKDFEKIGGVSYEWCLGK